MFPDVIINGRVFGKRIRGELELHTIAIPGRLDIDDVSFFFQKTLLDLDEVKPNKICFDFSNIKFIKPAGVVTLWNMVDYIEKQYPAAIFYRIPNDYKANPRKYLAIDYLDDSLFFEKVMGEKQHPFSQERATTNGLEKLKIGYYNINYINKTISWLKTNVHLRKKSFGTLETALGEVFNNINDHSKSPIGGCAFAQHYPRNKEINFCVADSGWGIPTRMRTKFTTNHRGEVFKNDSDTMLYATRAKVTTETKPSNRGMGFDNLLAIMENNKGSMIILSNKGKLTYDYNHNELRVPNKIRLYEDDYSYNGTLIMLNFKTDTLDIEEEEDFEW
ncbi:hypothetical protein BK133_05025 [Paenibacillus sp. FSL H8-0548]|uniref:hypothetical protein n=1 Tax=Paenibacillus sp. FSL H8-0548 TaxID=1920422 RepID=UPI00096F82A6|nr:hypothetical protein [Paenibacillus sp. FSL H8-0548]OMF37420.1 hypothetical protein BK133_05025 [Paenibacillus sp. FSL H8-0548]